MANQNVGKPGISTFGWLALGGAAAAYLSNADRRQKLMDTVRGFTGKMTGQGTGTTGTTTGGTTA